MTFNAKEVAEKFANEVSGMNVELRGPVLFLRLTKMIEEAHAAGVNEGLERAAKVSEENPITDFGNRIDSTDLKDNIAKSIRSLKEPIE